ncbi:ComF family protein [Bergeyella sp. RCAD1439]|uniref:ComF family protein n=1 Tax=Bergeyella anatis TaxID=3113737 RepID=UPI002E183C54|nr:ComF family protein [Bergeyella sp. RCAD1439]
MMILDFLFPNRCLGCSRIIGSEALVCNLCLPSIGFIHGVEGVDDGLEKRCRMAFPVRKAYGLMKFEPGNLSQKMIHQLKYGGREKVGRVLAEWVLERWADELKEYDLLVSIPLHPRKEKKRGYNQLHLFAETLAEHLGVQHDGEVLRRNFYKKAQAQKDRKEREGLLSQHPFSLNRPLGSPKKILLIDDVYTTGHTMASAAWELLKSGEHSIGVLVMAVDE